MATPEKAYLEGVDGSGLARANRVASVGVRWGYAAPDELERAGADRIVNGVDELAPALLAFA